MTESMLQGYNAAVSQNVFGVGPGAGAGPACGTCWALSPQSDSSGNALTGATSIIVKVNNLCPAEGNPLCSQPCETFNPSLEHDPLISIPGLPVARISMVPTSISTFVSTTARREHFSGPVALGWQSERQMRWTAASGTGHRTSRLRGNDEVTGVNEVKDPDTS